MPGKRPFELTRAELKRRLEEMVDTTFSDLASEFLLMPVGAGFINYPEFRDAYEILKQHTNAFQSFSATEISGALLNNSRVFTDVRPILGMTAPEWAELGRSELNGKIT